MPSLSTLPFHKGTFATQDHQAARGSPTPLPAHTDAPQNKTQQPAEHAPSTAMQGHAGPLEVNLTPTAAALLQQLAAQMQALAQGLATERNQATEQAQATQQQLATQIQALEQQLNQQQQTLQAAPQVRQHDPLLRQQGARDRCCLPGVCPITRDVCTTMCNYTGCGRHLTAIADQHSLSCGWCCLH